MAIRSLYEDGQNHQQVNEMSYALNFGTIVIV